MGNSLTAKHVIEKYSLNNIMEHLYNKTFKYHQLQANTTDDPNSHFQLGYIYHRGLGSIPQNLEKAFYHYQIAAHYNHPTAQYILAEFCKIRDGEEEDEESERSGVLATDSIELIRLKASMYIKSAARGELYSNAARELWQLYNNSTMWYNIVNEIRNTYMDIICDSTYHVKSDEVQRRSLAEIYNQLGYLAAHFKLDRMEDDYQHALQYYKTAGRLGSASSYYNIACMYHDGHGVVANKSTALHYYKKASKNGHALSQFIVAELLLSTIEAGQEMESARACYYYLQSSRYSFASTLLNLGYIFLHGIAGMKQSYTVALQYFEEAAVAVDFCNRKSNHWALHEIAYMHEHGLGTETNYKLAAAYYAEAAQYKYHESVNKLAKLLEKKKLPDATLEMAIQLYQATSTEGEHAAAYAHYRLGKIYWNNLVNDSPLKNRVTANKYFTAALQYYNDAIVKAPLPGHLYHLAIMYENGLGVKKDLQIAIRYYNRAVDESVKTFNIFDKHYGHKAEVKLQKVDQSTLDQRHPRMGDLNTQLPIVSPNKDEGNRFNGLSPSSSLHSESVDNQIDMLQHHKQLPELNYNSDSDEDLLGDVDSDNELKDILESEESKLEKRLSLVRKTFQLMKFKDLSQNHNGLDELATKDAEMPALEISTPQGKDKISYKDIQIHHAVKKIIQLESRLDKLTQQFNTMQELLTVNKDNNSNTTF
ncbi:uncharacterized protein TRIADDRAFT_60258 [Trichoplax adhaerens]|uniref:Uncharacterized protein n=1 Tax=Trichoplax adhaerens TaxID=10228 RepID=B3S7Q9_TRIAD|nr:hypothetical protein TRIADDRAFT_60258 [Trichoplax adhaerens]EDV21239.1 hypothetical protein TRIADDRAFT_60258 [Trichoplax adhaerens]|eukprot:XP_002116206.1 hypothetical protein TRIADDRAFT_60258 [Trichoplax adhaerens]